MCFSECFRTSGCSWCTSDKNGNLVNGFCDLKEICPSQQCLKDGMNLFNICTEENIFTQYAYNDTFTMSYSVQKRHNVCSISHFWQIAGPTVVETNATNHPQTGMCRYISVYLWLWWRPSSFSSSLWFLFFAK